MLSIGRFQLIIHIHLDIVRSVPDRSSTPTQKGRLMTLNQAQFAAVVKTAKTRTTDKRWIAAIDNAVAGVVSGWWIVTELHDGILVTTERGETYHANGACQCEAFRRNQPCKHRALARLIDRYNETAS